MEEHPIWCPTAEQIARARLTAYTKWLERERALSFPDYDALWRWSITDLEGFWRSIWDYFDVASESGCERMLVERTMPGARWGAGARVNFAEQVLRHARMPEFAERAAVSFESETGQSGSLTWGELEAAVAACARGLARLGVVPGDRVAAYLPNSPQTAIAFLACAALGATWSVCSPDMGPVAVLDRFRQIEPKVLIACDGYRYGGKDFDRSDIVRELRAGLPTVSHLVLLPWLDRAARPDRVGAQSLWTDLTAPAGSSETEGPAQPVWLPFDHPLWIVYSSGTTGMPKPIVHGHGGVLLESLKGSLHNDIGTGDRFHWYSSTGWIMWNSQVCGLLAGATICLYDGHPGYPDWTALWQFVGRQRVSVFGAGAAFFASCLKAGVKPQAVADLSCLRALGSTGSPLSPETYRWIYDELPASTWLNVIAGGTDFAGAFLAGNVTAPLYAGEMQARSLGAAVFAFDEAGRAIVDEVGELVCTEPIPSMPLYFVGDTDGRRLRESYFDTYPGVWRHGDWVRITRRGGGIIYGRSDATINRHGIRMGTSELYRAVEALPEVQDSMVVDLEYLGRPSYMALFVVMKAGHELDATLIDTIKARVRAGLSARHVPDAIVSVPEVPRTLSGKKLELPIKRLMLGHAPEKVLNRDAMANPAALDWYLEFARRYREEAGTRGG